MGKLNSPRTASVLSVVAALVLMLVVAQTVCAQRKGDPAPPGNPAPPPPSSNQSRPTATGTDLTGANQAFLDMELLVSGKSLNTDAIMERNRGRVAAQLNQDFRRLEQLNTEKIAPLLGAASLDYKKLSRATAEIKDRAMRIKYNIPFSLKRKGEKIRYESNADQLGVMLPELSRVIKSFTSNPVFHESGRNDAELRSTAGRDLEGIIKLSGTINKTAKRLSKASVASKSAG